MRWTDRLLSLLSTVILARLLVPGDFGLVAMAMVAVGFFDVLLDLGVGAALIQHEHAGREEFSTAWTLRLAQCVVTALLLVALTPLVADYYDDPRVVDVLRVAAITVIIGGFENIGTVSFQRNMELGRDFQFVVFKRLVKVACTIALAIALRSYWALILGSLVSRLVGVGASYWMSRFRPHLTLSRVSGIWTFSQWSLLTGIARYLNGAIPRLVLGGRANAAALGTYTVGEEVAMLPTSELLAPLGRVMFPTFAAARNSPGELLRLVTLAQAVQALLAIPLSLGVVLVADDAIPLLLGQQWTDAVPIAQIVALTGVATALGYSPGYMLTVTGRMHVLCGYTWAKTLLVVLADPAGVSRRGCRADCDGRAGGLCGRPRHSAGHSVEGASGLRRHAFLVADLAAGAFGSDHECSRLSGFGRACRRRASAAPDCRDRRWRLGLRP